MTETPQPGNTTVNPNPLSNTPTPTPPAPVPTGDTNGNEILQNQQNKEIIINEIMNMGFDRPQIEQALAAAFFNKERAIDYLLNGIPNDLMNEMSGNYLFA